MTTSNGAAAVAHPRSARQAHAGEYLTFRLGAEEYGIGILHVQEIRSYEPPTRIAGAQPHVKGVVNLRGVIVPVVDLRLRLGCARAAIDGLTVVIVLNVGDSVVGAVVDAVSDVVELGAAQIKPAPQLDAQADSDCITGIGCVGSGDAGRMLILMDIEGLIGEAKGVAAGGARSAAREPEPIGL